MKRVLLGLILGALIFGVAFAGAKVATVTNPMSADLDGGGHAIFDVGNITLDGDLTASKGVVYLDGNHNRPSIRVGTTDPNTDPAAADAQPGSLYLESAFDASGLWVETSPDVWQRATVAP